MKVRARGAAGPPDGHFAFLQAGTLSPGTGASPGAEHRPGAGRVMDLSPWFTHSSAVRCGHASPLSLHTPGSSGDPVPSDGALGRPLLSLPPEGKFALDFPSPSTPGRSCVYRCTQCLQPSFLPSLPRTGPDEKGQAKAGPDTAPQPPPHPLQDLRPKTRGLWAESRSWVALFCSSTNFSLHRFPLAPVGVWGLVGRTDLCNYFHTFPVQSGVGVCPPSSP